MNFGHKILVTAPLDFLPELRSRMASEVLFTYAYGAPREEILELLLSETFDGWMVAPCPSYRIDAEMLSLVSTIKCISTPSTGINHIDLDACRLRNITVLSLRESEIVRSITASSEFTFELMFSLIRKTSKAFDLVLSGQWRDAEKFVRGRELSALKIGIIGYGRIGSNVSRYANAFGMEVVAFDPYVNIRDTWVSQVSSLRSMLPIVDVVMPCVHLSDDTLNLIGRPEFELMKDGVYFVNTSRGEVVDEDALLWALQTEKVAAAGLDVIKGELTTKIHTSSLIEYARNHDNLLITPHIAGLTYDSERKAQTNAYERLIDCLENLE